MMIEEAEMDYMLIAGNNDYGNLDLSHVEIGGIVATILPAIRYIFMLMPYDSLTTVIVAVFMMKGPKQIWANERAADRHLR